MSATIALVLVIALERAEPVIARAEPERIIALVLVIAPERAERVIAPAEPERVIVRVELEVMIGRAPAI